MKIGILFKHRETGGGIYQYFLSLLEALVHAGREDQLFVFYQWVRPPLAGPGNTCIMPIRLTPGSDPSISPFSRPLPDPHEAIWKGEIIRFKAESLSKELLAEATRRGIDVMLYPTPEREAFEVGIPYVMAVHDVGHKTLPHFPEFTGKAILKQREYVYTEGIRNASFILVESETGKKQVLTYYDLEPERIIVLPFIPPSYIIETPLKEQKEAWERRKRDLPARFIFYPAQFWPHKNHATLIKALHLIKKREGVMVPVAFTGGDDPFGSLQRLRKLARELEVLNQIAWLGYLETPHMRLIYETAAALVMPTFLGPTNLPILEAFATGCPVITSDIPGASELVGDAALLVDPESPEEIAASILRIWEDETLRETLKRRGKERIAGWTGEKFSSRLMSVIDAFRTGGHGTMRDLLQGRTQTPCGAQ